MKRRPKIWDDDDLKAGMNTKVIEHFSTKNEFMKAYEHAKNTLRLVFDKPRDEKTNRVIKPWHEMDFVWI